MKAKFGDWVKGGAKSRFLPSSAKGVSAQPSKRRKFTPIS